MGGLYVTVLKRRERREFYQDERALPNSEVDHGVTSQATSSNRAT